MWILDSVMSSPCRFDHICVCECEVDLQFFCVFSVHMDYGCCITQILPLNFCVLFVVLLFISSIWALYKILAVLVLGVHYATLARLIANLIMISSLELKKQSHFC